MSGDRPLLFVDAGAGASGDMILGALVELGVPAARIRRAIETLPLSGWKIRVRRIRRAGLSVRKVDVLVSGRPRDRGWREIRRIIRGGDLERAVRDRALEVFRRLIEAEAKVHGVSPEKVKLHEVGAVDAIVDVVGACVGFDHLSPRRIVVSPMTTGFGTVLCRHGSYPVPAPATALLVRGFPVRAGEIEAERLTPTGAAILTVVADEWGEMPLMLPRAVGYGAGDHDLGDHPNALRMVLGDAVAWDTGTAQASGIGGPGRTDRPGVVVLEFTVDDATPQRLAFAAERLFERGALEVFTTPVVMKKGRSGHHVTVLGRPETSADLADLILRETSTLGLRYRLEERLELERSIRKVRTRFGTVSVKIGRTAAGDTKAWPEYEECAALARRHGVPFEEVFRSVRQAYERRTAGPGGGRARPGKKTKH